MNYSSYLLISCLVIGLMASNASRAQSTPELLSQIGIGLMLTENYQEAEQCFAKLVQEKPADADVYTNRGINQAMWGLSLLKTSEAEELIKYVFPFEVKPNSGKRGNIDNEQQFITQLFISADEQFEQAVRLRPDDAGAYLNLASIKAILSRWQQKPQLLRQANDHIQLALSKASANSSTKGYSLIVQGIICDYIGNTPCRDDHFRRAQEQHKAHPDPQLASLAQRNKAVADGQPAVFVRSSGEKYNVFDDKAETIDGVSLGELMNQVRLPASRTVATLGEAKLYDKEYTNSTLYLYHQNENRYVVFHQTDEDYNGKSGKGIGIGDNASYVRNAYGSPTRIRPATGGEYWLYKKAGMLFFICTDRTVKSWMVWRGKGG